MPTPIETEVMRLLTSVDVQPAVSAARIMELGTPAVTVVCEAALGSYPGLRNKTRTNAVALLGWLAHPQAAETVALLVGDEDPDVAIRALRAAGRSGNQAAVARISALLTRPETPPVIAAEAVRSLSTVGSPNAVDAVETYRHVGENVLAHRGSTVVRTALEEGPLA